MLPRMPPFGLRASHPRACINVCSNLISNLALIAEDCPDSPSCRSTTAGVGSLRIYQQPCASSDPLSDVVPGLAVGPCQAVTVYDGGPTPGSCDGEPDGYTYLHIQ